MKKFKTARKRSFSSYSKRNRILRKMGFPTYGDYLKSDLWKEIRGRVFQVKGQWCRMCSTTATQLHHQRYSKSDLDGSRLKYIFPICGTCHKFVEFAEDGTKLDLIEVRRLFNHCS